MDWKRLWPKWWQDVWKWLKVAIFALGDKKVFQFNYDKYGTLSMLYQMCLVEWLVFCFPKKCISVCVPSIKYLPQIWIKYYCWRNSSFFPVTKAKNKLLESHKDRFQLLAITITIHSSSNSTVGQKSNKRFWKLITFFPSLVWFLMSFSFSIWVNDIKTLATIYDDFFSLSIQLQKQILLPIKTYTLSRCCKLSICH